MASGSKADGSPIFFYMEREKDFGFLSNFYSESFTAPDPAGWIFEYHNSPATSSNNIGTEGNRQEKPTMDFSHSEKYFMYCKALYFGDEHAAVMILKAKSPTECKSLGRAVKLFSQEKWEKDDINVRVMEEALWWKFGGGQLRNLLRGPEKYNLMAGKGKRLEAVGDLGRRLLATGERQLIEASGRDRYWGIGYSVKQGPHSDKKNWGRNQLGKSLMAVRKRLRVLVESDASEA